MIFIHEFQFPPLSEKENFRIPLIPSANQVLGTARDVPIGKFQVKRMCNNLLTFNKEIQFKKSTPKIHRSLVQLNLIQERQFVFGREISTAVLLTYVTHIS